MTAYELADLMIQFDSGRVWEHAQEIASTLRQQADKIADLQTTINFLEDECKALRGQVNEL
jgi:O-succinylbenzoate synthase